MKSTKFWIILIAIIAIAAAVGVYVVYSITPGTVARVYSGGELVREIDLSRVQEAYSFTVTSENGGENVVSVEPGRIRVSSADCPDKICVNQGWIDTGAAPIVCLPNELVIRLTDPDGTENAIDAVS